MKITNKDYAPLHVHGEHSKLDGLATVSKLITYCREKGFPALALTDHGNMGGIIKLIKQCQATKDKKGNHINTAPIKPIPGFEAYMSLDRHAHNSKMQPEGKAGNYHLTLLAQNFEGYSNLSQLCDLSWKEGFYYSPRIDFDLLNKHSKGLIVLSGCVASIINHNIIYDRYDQAVKLCSIFKDILKDNFFIELMYHGLNIESKVLPYLIKISKDLKIPLVATNDSHYIKKEDHSAHDVLLAISMSDCVNNQNRMKFTYDQFYVKEAHEMLDIFEDYPESILNTVEIANRVDIKDITSNLFGTFKLPVFPFPKEFNSLKEYFIHLTWEGAKGLGWMDQRHKDRIQRELNDLEAAYEINNYDFYAYFMLVRWIIKKAIDKGIAVNYGRGSVYASCVARCLGITFGTIDPIEYNLTWERFLGFTKKKFITRNDFGLNKKEASMIIDKLISQEAEEELEELERLVI